MGVYYWRVAVIDPSGSNIYSGWSAIQYFETVDNAPPLVSLNAPNNGATGVPPQSVLSFTVIDPEGDDVEYEVQVDTVDTFNSNSGGSASVSYSDSFESVGWTSVLVSGSSAVWTTATSSAHPTGISIQDGSYLAGFNSYTCTAGVQARYYPGSSFSITASATAARLTFYMYHEIGYTSADDRVQLQLSLNSGENWSNVGSAVSRYD